MSATLLDPDPTADGSTGRNPRALTEGKQSLGILIALWVFVILPFAALVAAVPVAWGWGLSWLDVAIGLVFYCVSGLGIGTGFHRYLTHGAFKANRGLRIGLTIAGSTALEGNP